MSGLPWSRCRLLRLSRGVEQFDDLLAWFHEPEGFAWPVVEFLGDRVEVVLRVDGWVGAFGEVPAQEPVGVLVGAALPRGVRVAEVDGLQRGADPFVQGEFRSLVPGQAVAQEFGRVLHLVDDGLPGVFGVVPVGQVQQDREPGGALDERADGAFVAAAGDEIALPVARGRPVLDLRGSLRDHDHGFAETGFAALAALGSAGGSPLPHGAFQLLLEFAPGLQVDGLVDRLDARVHVSIIREVRPQPVGYLLRAPMPAQPGGDLVPQSRALGRLARFGAFEPVRGLLPGAAGLVTAGLGIPVALDLAADRAGVAAQQAGDGADRIAQTQTVRDLDALLLAQVARMEGLGFVHGGTIPVRQGFLVPSRGARPAVAPRLAGAFRDADRVRGLGEVHAFLVQQAHVLGASRLAHQLPRRILDAVERPTVFPAMVFVSVASGHLTLLAVGQVLQRSLEPAGPVVFGGGQWHESIYLVLGERRLVAPGARLAQGDGRHGQGRGTHLLNRSRGAVQAGKATCDRKAVGEPLMLGKHLDDPPISIWNGSMPFFMRNQRWMEA